MLSPQNNHNSNNHNNKTCGVVSNGISTGTKQIMTSNDDHQNLKRQFEAAVNVIRNLPSEATPDAPFQPSNDLKLKFYAYFKQATEGPNNTSKPYFYDVVGIYKWNAWKNLGKMSRDDAMKGYVNELKQIVETMSLSQPVADFYEVLGPFYEFVFPDQNSDPNRVKKSPSLPSLNNSSGQPGLNGSAAIPSDHSNHHPQNNYKSTPNKHPVNAKMSTPVGNGSAIMMNGAAPTEATSTGDQDSDGEEFSDTYNDLPDADLQSPSSSNSSKDNEIIQARGDAELKPRVALTPASSGRSSTSRQILTRGISTPGPGASGYGASGSAGGSGQGPSGPQSLPDVKEQLAIAVLRLQQSMEQVCNRLDTIERNIGSPSRGSSSPPLSSWWPLKGLSPTATMFLIVWPFVAQYIMHQIQQRRLTGNKK